MNSDRKTCHSKIYRKTYLEIDLGALRSNFIFLKNKTKSKWLCPMVKANAYGHGAVEVVRTLVEEGEKVFGVSLIEEAIELREAGFKNVQILVFSPLGADSVGAIDAYHLTPVVTHKGEISLLESTLQTRVDVHLKVNTGMNRLGISLNDTLECVDGIKSSKKMRLVGLCTHLSHGEDIDISKRQLSQLMEVSGNIDVPIHLLNSASLAFLSDYSDLAHHLDFGFRLGISLYGLSPNGEVDGLIPVMSLKSEIVQCHKVNKGEGVSYGWTWRAERPSLIGVVPIGYADGISRSLSNKISFLVNRQRVPQVGTICMDYVMVDLTDVFPDDRDVTGSIVEIFGCQQGEHLSIQDWANRSETISYEVLSRMGSRVPRKYVG